MFALSQLVDIPQIFSRLDALPRELATARQELWAAEVQANEALREYNQQADSKDTPAMKEAWGCFLVMQEEQAARKANLADLNNEMSALRKKIDLITALTMGRQETTEGVLLRRLLKLVRSVPGQVEETILETEAALGAEPPPELGHYEDAHKTVARAIAEEAEPPPELGHYEAGDPLPF